MSYAMAIFLGFVQGVAEFLPISSSGHLALLQSFFGLTDVEHDHVLFDVLLHLGTLISVCIVYRQDIMDMIREFCLGVMDLITRHGGKTPPARRLVLLVILATLPLVAVVPIKDIVEGLYSNTFFIGGALIATGCILFFADRMARGRKNERTATLKDALLVGCAQALAVVPGLSRSGSTISAGMLCGLDRGFAVRFSFLLSLPAILGANILSIGDAVQAGFDAALLPVYGMGILVAAVSGYFAIRLVRLLSEKGKFGGFAYYCWAVGGISIAASLILK